MLVVLIWWNHQPLQEKRERGQEGIFLFSFLCIFSIFGAVLLINVEVRDSPSSTRRSRLRDRPNVLVSFGKLSRGQLRKVLLTLYFQ